jgi:hypothetical protein
VLWFLQDAALPFKSAVFFSKGRLLQSKKPEKCAESAHGNIKQLMKS